MTPDRGKQALLTALGVTAGVATGIWLWSRREPGGQPEPTGWSRPHGTGADVAEALRSDGALSHRSIEVDSIADGVIELTGAVESREEAERAVSLAQGTQGVFTVVNRLVVEAEEAHREETRRRREAGAPELQGSGHTGMGVGMGTRRQSPDTDPDRPSDKQKILDRQLNVQNVEDAAAGGLDPISGAEAVESTDMKPGDERAIEEAGLDAGPRPTSAPRESRLEEPGSEESGPEESSPQESAPEGSVLEENETKP